MALTFADTHNMIAFLTKSDASDGFEQITDFLNAHVIQYALMVNPTIYVSCIKQFWTSVSIKKSNDVVRLQALMDRKKVIITEDSTRQDLRLDDADGRKFNFLKYFFDNLVRNVDSPSKFYMYPRFLQLIINAKTVDLSSHNTKYTSLTLTQKVFANMRRIGKGFSGVDTPLFDGMLVPQQAQDVEDAAEDEDDVNEVSAEPTPPSPTPATSPLTPQQEHIPSPSQAEIAQPSPPPQPLPSQTAKISMNLLNTLLETCATLTKQVANLEQDKIAQAIEITKLKQRVKRLEKKRQFKSSGLKRLRKERLEESQAKVYHLDLELAEKVLSMQETDEAEPAEVEEVIKLVTVAKLMTELVTTAAPTITATPVPKASAPRRKRGVIIQDPEEAAIVSRKERQDNTVMRYQALKRKPVTEAQARKNMMVYLKNMAGFKMNFFRGMTYIKIRPIFENHYNSIQAFLEKGDKEIEEEGSKRKSKSSKQRAAKKQRIDEEVEKLKTHLQIIPNDKDDVYTKATPLALKVPVVHYQIHHENNKPFYKIIRADGTHQLFLSFITLLKNFDREYLEMMWKLVQERFQSLEPKNFSDDFLLNTLKIMFEKPNVEAIIWRKQKGRYGLAKVKRWKLYESCGVYIITFTTTQMILLVKRKYPWTRFTLEQMLNNVRLEVEEESEMPLVLLSFRVDAVEDFKKICEEITAAG
nr:hypothetical protein [Tanacetum cinerariifolium]